MTEQSVASRDLANAIRALAMDAVQQADSGHPGMPMGMADVATVLFSKFLKFDPKTEKFIGNKDADALLTRKYRAPFVVPEKV